MMLMIMMLMIMMLMVMIMMLMIMMLMIMMLMMMIVVEVVANQKEEVAIPDRLAAKTDRVIQQNRRPQQQQQEEGQHWEQFERHLNPILVPFFFFRVR